MCSHVTVVKLKQIFQRNMDGSFDPAFYLLVVLCSRSLIADIVLTQEFVFVMATFACLQCNHQQSVPDGYIGKRTKCPKCGESGTVKVGTELVTAEVVMPVSQEGTVVLRQPGGSIRTPLSRTIILNKESSLEREFITVIDKSLPAGLTSCVGIITVYEPETDYSTGQYQYSASYAVKALAEIRAFEVRFLIFNLWGKHVHTLTATEIADLSAGEMRQCDGKWDLFDENEACEHYASIAYLAKIRTASGQVLEADIEPIIAEAKHFSSKFTDADLEPTPRPR